MLKLASWYHKHLGYIKQPYEIVLITQQYKTYQSAKEIGINAMTIQEYIQRNEPGSELADYLGIEVEIEDKAPIFPEHITVPEAIDMIKQGKLFDGRISYDRNDISNARILVRQF